MQHFNGHTLEDVAAHTELPLKWWYELINQGQEQESFLGEKKNKGKDCKWAK